MRDNMPVRPMSGVIFTAIDTADVDPGGAGIKERSRSETPDSGQGGYFTQSESDSGGSRQSPIESHHIYKISRPAYPQEKVLSQESLEHFGIERLAVNLARMQTIMYQSSATLGHEPVSIGPLRTNEANCRKDLHIGMLLTTEVATKAPMK